MDSHFSAIQGTSAAFVTALREDQTSTASCRAILMQRYPQLTCSGKHPFCSLFGVHRYAPTMFIVFIPAGSKDCRQALIVLDVHIILSTWLNAQGFARASWCATKASITFSYTGSSTDQDVSTTVHSPERNMKTLLIQLQLRMRYIHRCQTALLNPAPLNSAPRQRHPQQCSSQHRSAQDARTWTSQQGPPLHCSP